MKENNAKSSSNTKIKHQPG